MHSATPKCRSLIAAALVVTSLGAQADSITDWNARSGEFIADARLGTPPAVRVMAIVQTAAYDAVVTAQRDVSADAAVAAAHRVTLLKLLPAQQAAIDAAYQAALAAIADGPARAAGVMVGEKSAAAVLAARMDDGAATPEAYRPHTSAGVYVPTAMPAIPQWPQRRPWLMASAAQFRPAAPPALGSDAWARDYNEVKLMGASRSAKRSAELTEIARFWEYSLPAIYFGVLRSVAMQPQRSLAQNALMYAAAAQAMDDALIAVFDAKYHYNFWRPATAIRNGDIDGNDATARDAGWAPLVEAPLHPEYPSAHATLAAAVAEVLKADAGNGRVPALSTSSPTAKGAVRRWSTPDAFVAEVGEARIAAGIHYRAATETGAAMGRRVGELATQRLYGAAD